MSLLKLRTNNSLGLAYALRDIKAGLLLTKIKYNQNMTKLSIKPNTVIGEGSRSFTVEKVTSDMVYVRGSQENNPLRHIPRDLIETLVTAIRENRITLQDIQRRYRADKGLPHLFDELELSYDKFILGYDATIQKLCEYMLEQPAQSSGTKQKHIALVIPKPFLLLAGISGTGKSRFVRQQAEMGGLTNKNYELVAVRPDWHEPSDLLGYVSRLSGTAEYVTTPVLRFIVKAWQELLDKGCTLPDENGTLDDVLLTGTSEQLDTVLPYWLCLDEMNLAPVEQYFADYLALIETREWSWDDDNFEYSCGALLAADTLNALGADAQQKLAVELGLTVEHLLWQHFLQHGIAIPPNLIVAGTVNMDETTHGFSRKVIDRAMSFDFGEFFPNDFDDFYTSSISQVPLTFPRYSSGKEALDDTDAKASIEFLQAINAVLKNTPFELAYRALNELLLAVHCHGASDNDADLQAVWDDFLMQKVLPRIEGDADKLQQDDQGDLLSRLQAVLETRLDRIWGDDPESPTRTDFYRTRKDSQIKIPCRSRQKIRWMRERLESSGFTSFWP